MNRSTGRWRQPRVNSHPEKTCLARHAIDARAGLARTAPSEITMLTGAFVFLGDERREHQPMTPIAGTS